MSVRPIVRTPIPGLSGQGVCLYDTPESGEGVQVIDWRRENDQRRMVRGEESWKCGLSVSLLGVDSILWFAVVPVLGEGRRLRDAGRLLCAALAQTT